MNIIEWCGNFILFCCCALTAAEECRKETGQPTRLSQFLQGVLYTMGYTCMYDSAMGCVH